MFQPLQKGGFCRFPSATGDESASIPSGALVRLVWGELPRPYQPQILRSPMSLMSMTGPSRMQRNSWKNYRNWVRPSPMDFAWWLLHGNSFKACVGLPELSWLNMIQVFARDCRSFRFATMTWHEQKCFRQVVLRIGAPYHSLWHQISSYNFYHFFYLYMTVIVEYLSVFHIYTWVFHATLTTSWFHTIFHPKRSLLSSRPAVLAWRAAKPRRCNSRIRQKHELLLSCLIIFVPKTTSCKRYGLRYAWFTFCVHRTCFFCDKWWWFLDGRLVPMFGWDDQNSMNACSCFLEKSWISTHSKRCEICWSPWGDI